MGRPQWEMIVASVARRTLQLISFNRSTVCPAGSGEAIAIYAPPGYVGEIQGFYVHVPVNGGATSGQHDVMVAPTNGAGNTLLGRSNWNKEINYDFGHWTDADVSQQPATEISQLQAMKGMFFDDVQGLGIAYNNNTNIASNNVRAFYLSYIKTAAAK